MNSWSIRNKAASSVNCISTSVKGRGVKSLSPHLVGVVSQSTVCSVGMYVCVCD